VKDFKEIWWSPTATGQDEYGNSGTGAIMNVDGGRRYQVGQWPATPPNVFEADNAVVSRDDAFFWEQYQVEVADPIPGSRACRYCA
jgi:hypothetical protein